ncbi:MAG: glycosyltransferase family 4 protein [Chloroflexi bacterium]|nr:glycosyltransferase family 4 protein [Chloroflexota bacterium]
MKICFYSATRSPLDILEGRATNRGGAEKQIAHLALALAERGHQVYLLYSDPANNEQPDKLRGIYCRRMSLTTWKHPGAITTFWRHLKQIQPDIIYARLPDDFLWLLGLFARVHKVKFVYALANDAHCNPWKTYNYKAWFHNSFYAFGLYTAHVVLTQHAGQRALVQPYTTGKLMYLPNLMPPISEQPRDYRATDFDAIWVAQVRPQKQLSIFLELVEQLSELRFAIVGAFTDTVDEQTQAQLKARIQKLPNLTYLGLQKPKETLCLLAHSKILVNTSCDEGFPNTMLEAWSVGVPVVSLTVDPGGVIQREGLGSVSGTFSQLMADTKQLVHSYALNSTCGANGLHYVQKHHGLEIVMTTFEQLMNEQCA